MALKQINNNLVLSSDNAVNTTAPSAIVTRSTTNTLPSGVNRVELDATAASFVQTLPPLINYQVGEEISIKCVHTNANIVTLLGNGTENIDGVTLYPKPLSAYDSIVLYKSKYNNWAVKATSARDKALDLGVGTSIDWSASLVHYNDIAANKAYTFANALNGQVLILTVKNTSGGVITLTFPTTINNALTVTVQPAKENVYTFVKANNKIYATVVDGMA